MKKTVKKRKASATGRRPSAGAASPKKRTTTTRAGARRPAPARGGAREAGNGAPVWYQPERGQPGPREAAPEGRRRLDEDD